MIASTATIPKLRILVAMGTRPEIIKQAPVVWAARRHPQVTADVLHSGQHTDLAEPMLDYFDIRPTILLDLMHSHHTLNALVGGCIQRMGTIFSNNQYDVAVVQGDTATSASIALAAFYCKIPIVHVEAGLRTGDLSSPWPEEFNRRLTTLATSLHCAPTNFARDQLLREGVRASTIFMSGNPIVDALNWTLIREQTQLGSAQSRHSSPLVVITAHRRENFGKPLEEICSAVLELANLFADHRFVFVTHPNPQAGPVVKSILDGKSRIELAPPMTYPQFVSLMHASRLIISDSGGIQEEAPSLGVPLLVTRTSTERPEAVQCGAAELVGTDRRLLVQRASELLSSTDRPERVANPFGDGASGERIIQEIVTRFGVCSA